MKNAFYTCFTTLLLAVILIGCEPSDKSDSTSNHEPGTTCNSFAYLMYYQDSIKANWRPKDTFDRIVFIPFDSGAGKPWQLISYGQLTYLTYLKFTRLSNPFPIFSGKILDSGRIKDAKPISIQNFALSNLDISDTTLKKIVNDKTNGANVLLFVPYFLSDAGSISSPLYPVQHLHYQLFLGRYDPSSNRISVIHLNPATYGMDLNPASGAIDLNPCPPAHKNID